jgi:hypothetical protein
LELGPRLEWRGRGLASAAELRGGRHPRVPAARAAGW